MCRRSIPVDVGFYSKSRGLPARYTGTGLAGTGTVCPKVTRGFTRGLPYSAGETVSE